MIKTRIKVELDYDNRLTGTVSFCTGRLVPSLSIFYTFNVYKLQWILPLLTMHEQLSVKKPSIHIAMKPKNSFTEGGGGGNKALFREWQLKLHLWIAVIQFRLEIHHKEHERQLHIRLK